ncbi:MAG: protein kinase [Gemmatimonadetes bacterium]|nr:protein kinase [Gemmatimonadota bacterium]
MEALADRLREALGSAYQLGPVLGQGGMAVVFRATDRRLRREVAVKVLPPQLGYSPNLHARFVREAQMAAQLSHPNIVQIYDVGEQAELAWFIMALVEGETVRAKVEREGAQPISVVRRVLQEVAQALAYSHARGVVHRDIKPDNILIESASGQPMVTDFGIAKAIQAGSTEVTKPGEIVGTARYMAPEQALSEGEIDGRADIYSLGLVGHFMLSGTHAIQAGTLPAVIVQHVRGVTIDLAALERRLPRPLVTALNRCLESVPDNRYARAEELADALREIGGELPDTLPVVRKLLRESERFFVSITVGGFAFGLIGVERIPHALMLILAAGVLMQWTNALEQASRRGVTWGAIRRALYVERAGRVQEVTEAGPVRIGLSGFAVVVLLLVGVVLLSSGAGFLGDSWINQGLFYLGAFGGMIAASVFGMRKVTRAVRLKELSRRGVRVLAVITLVGAAAGFAVGGALVFTAVAVLGGVGMLAAHALARRQQRLQSKVEANEAAEWQIPRWLDVMGSWLFGRFVHSGWRIGFERDKPAALAATLNMTEAKQLLKQVRRTAATVTGSARVAAEQAARLADELVQECHSAVRRLKPLTTKMARLNDGVMVSKTIGLGASLEGELDRVEAEVDGLRSRADEYVQMLRALVTGLEVARESRNTTQLDKALARVRELSSAVRRMTEEVSVAAEQMDEG